MFTEKTTSAGLVTPEIEVTNSLNGIIIFKDCWAIITKTTIESFIK